MTEPTSQEQINLFRQESAGKEPWQAYAVTIVVVVGVLVVLLLARNVLGPYIMGLLLAYVLLPVVRWLETQVARIGPIARFARPIAVLSASILTLAGIAIVIAVMLEPIIDQVRHLLLEYETYWETIKTEQDGFRKVYLELVPTEAQEWIDANMGKVGSAIMSGSSGLLQWLFLTSGSIASALVAFFAVPLFMVYYLLDERHTVANIRSRLPAIWAEDLVASFQTMDRILGSYTRGVVVESVIVGIITGLGYWIVGIHLALPLGIIAFAGEIVPIIGPWLAFAISFPVVLATQSDKAIWAAAVFLVVQVIEGWVLAPRIRARSVDFSATGTLILIAIGGAIAGSIGIVFVLPAAAILRALAIYAYFRTHGHNPETALGMTPMFAGDSFANREISPT
jgi:predicted PurR-regulated permease PerM